MADPSKGDEGTHAKQILVRRIVNVTMVMKENLVFFYQRLLQKALIVEGLYDPNCRTKTNEEHALVLYRACMTAVNTDSSNFSTFLDILSECSLLGKTVQEMESEGKLSLYVCK